MHAVLYLLTVISDSFRWVTDHVSVIFTVVLALSTMGLWWQTKRLAQGAKDQIVQSNKSIAEAARSAGAMEKVAESLAVTSKASQETIELVRKNAVQQMRAYLSVVVGTGVYQEREKQLKFEVKPLVVNSGHTPAYKVCHSLKAAIVLHPLPEDFDFSVPEHDSRSESTIGQQQTRLLSAIVEDYVDDARVEDIKRGSSGRMLTVWGKVTYEDAFGIPRHVNFCHAITWLANGNVFAYYSPRHADSN